MGRLHLHLVGDPDLVEPVRRERGEEYDQDLRDSPFLYLLNAAGTREICHCACGVGSPVAARKAQRDFPILEELAIAGATDWFRAELIPVGMVTEAFPDKAGLASPLRQITPTALATTISG